MIRKLVIVAILCLVVGTSGCMTFAPITPTQPTATYTPTSTPISMSSPTGATLNLDISDTYSGTTSPGPGTYTYSCGDSVSVTATPVQGQTYFAFWTVDGSYIGTTNPITVTMDRSHDLEAYFNQKPVLDVVTSPSSTAILNVLGTTVPAPGNYTYNYGDSVSVTAVPAADCMFDYWIVDGVSYQTENPITLKLDNNRSICPIFSMLPVLDIVPTSPISFGTTAPKGRMQFYPFGDTVSVTAAPDARSTFIGWTTSVGWVTKNPITLIMDGRYTLTPLFNENSPPDYLLKVGPLATLGVGTSTGGTFTGPASPSSTEYDCNFGDRVSVTAIPDAGYTFECWTFNEFYYSAQNTITVPVQENDSVYAIFSPLPTLNVSVNSGQGTTNPAPGTYTYNYGGSVSVSAIPATGYNFSYWIIGENYFAQNPITFTMYDDEGAEAVFTPQVANTSTTLTSSANPSVAGQVVTFTATVSAVSPGAGTPTGTVTFKDGATGLGTGTLDDSGQATCTTSNLSVGGHTISAVYEGDTSFTASTDTLNQIVNKASTQTVLTSSANPSLAGQVVTFMATVSAVSPGAGTLTGTVTFQDGAAVLGTGILDDSGQATYTTSNLSVGDHAISAVYGGDTSFAASTDTLTQYVVTFTVLKYIVTFTESGLAAGTSWSVKFNGQSNSSTGSAISFANVANGKYNWSLTAPSGYSASPASGTVTVKGANVNQSITFTALKYTVTFTESGLAAGTSWSVKFNGQSKSSTAKAISFANVANGKYDWSLTAPIGYTASPTSGTVTVKGANVNQSVTFSVLKSIAVTPASPPNLAVGSTQQFKATGTYSDGSTSDISSSVIWNSDNTSVATIDSKGLATGVTAGTTNITASLSAVKSQEVVLMVSSP